jgi:hypothetical protein
MKMHSIAVSLDDIASELGFGESDSESERFTAILSEAVQATNRDVETSHREGLSLDCYRVLEAHLIRI